MKIPLNGEDALVKLMQGKCIAKATWNSMWLECSPTASTIYLVVQVEFQKRRVIYAWSAVDLAAEDWYEVEAS